MDATKWHVCTGGSKLKMKSSQVHGIIKLNFFKIIKNLYNY